MVKIEEGKYYKTRDGRKVGPMVPIYGLTYAWRDHDAFYYTAIGALYQHGQSDRDLIEEWRDPIDVYTIPTMPFGLLTPEQQQALRDLPSGCIDWYCDGKWVTTRNSVWALDLTYRAKPKPKRETVTNREMYITPRGCIASNGLMDGARRVTITYDTVDGVIDATTYRVALR